MSEVGAQRARVESANASKVWRSAPPPLRQRGYGGSRDYHCQKLARNAREWNPPTHPKFGAQPHPPCGSVATGDPVTIIVRSWRATRGSGIRQRIQSLVLSPHPPCGSVATGDPVTIIVRSWRATPGSGIPQRIQIWCLVPPPLRQRGYGGSRDYHCQKLARNAREWNPPTHPKFSAQSPPPLRQRGYGGSRDYHCQKLARNAREWNPPTHPKFSAQPHPPCGSVATGDPVTIIVRSWRATRASGIRQRIQSLALSPTPPAAAWLRGIP